MGPLGLTAQEQGSQAFGGAGRRPAGLIPSTPAWNKPLKSGGNGGESSQEQRGSRLSWEVAGPAR